MEWFEYLIIIATCIFVIVVFYFHFKNEKRGICSYCSECKNKKKHK